MSDQLNELPEGLDAYVRKAAALVRPRSRRMEVERELRSHALEILDELNGHSPEAATAEVLRRLGDVMNLGDLLAEANRTPLQKLLLRVSGAALILGFVAIIAGYAYIQADLNHVEQQYAAELKQKFPIFVSVQEKWSQDPFFAERSGHRDAGPLIGDKFRWRRDENDPLAIPPDIRGRLQKAFQEGGLKAQMALDLSTVDLKWMARLKDYDFWEYFRSGKGQEALNEALAKRMFTPRGPDLVIALAIAEVRFIQGLQTGMVLEALEEVAELARLLTTTENLLAFQIGVNLRYHSLPLWEERAVKAGLLNGGGRFTAMENQDLRAGGIVYTYLMLNYLTPPEYLQELLDHPERKAGRCTAIAEMLWAKTWWGVYLESDPWPWERDFRAGAELRKKLLQHAGDCRLTWYRSGGFDSVDRNAVSFFVSGPPPWWERLFVEWTGRLPYLRRVFALMSSRSYSSMP